MDGRTARHLPQAGGGTGVAAAAWERDRPDGRGGEAEASPAVVWAEWRRQREALSECLREHIERQESLIELLLRQPQANGQPQAIKLCAGPTRQSVTWSPSTVSGGAIAVEEDKADAPEPPPTPPPSDAPASSAPTRRNSGRRPSTATRSSVCSGGVFSLALQETAEALVDLDSFGDVGGDGRGTSAEEAMVFMQSLESFETNNGGGGQHTPPTVSEECKTNATFKSAYTRETHAPYSKRSNKKTKSLLKFLKEQSDVHDQAPTAHWLPKQVMWLCDTWSHLEEPPRSGWLRAVVYSRAFEIMVTVTIIANTIFTTYQANYEMEHLGAKPSESLALDGLFLSIFILEIFAKLGVHRLYYFVNDDMNWNWFDFLLVGFSLFDFIFSDSELVKVSFARSLRIFKMGKVLRVFRTMRFLKELRVMVTSILGSLVSLGWSLVLLGLILFVFALFFVQQMSAHQLEMGADYIGSELYDLQRSYFSTVEESILTLSMCTTGGKDWEDVWVLVKPLGWWSSLAFIFYIAFFTFAVMNILTGIFVENALQLAAPSEKEALITKKNQAEREALELTTILETLDGDGDGCINLQEFTQIMQNERVTHMLSKLGVDIKDAKLLFTTVARLSNQNSIDIPEFVRQIMRLKGQALSMDLHAVIVQMHQLRRSVDQIASQLPARSRPSRQRERRHAKASQEDLGGNSDSPFEVHFDPHERPAKPPGTHTSL